ncbi:MAG TPA: tRNA pseudouridine(13) synthase TruD [Tepidisphaeraceae bacterium]|nr:tRNA pseudouridine(13) synthase TruD [Tepidisphaeraceae bacterium]
MNLPYLTPDFPGIGGTIKNRAEDFFVQEIPLYEPSGTGEHVYCEIQKVNLTTFEAVNRIAACLRVSPRDIGFSGLKDAKAVSRQVLSIVGTTEQAVMDLRVPDVTINWAVRHDNKLRLGHLAGNRFAIKIRDINPTDVVRLQPVLDEIQKRGMPNYFGEQRFGRRNDNDRLGAALIRGDNKQVLHLLLGSPDPAIDDEETVEARRAFDAGDFPKAMRLFPRRSGMERRILARFAKERRPGAAVRMIDEKIRRLWVSALQSKMFNEVLSRRIGTLDRLMDGDLAYKHENGACFRVEHAAVEQSRADGFEISPTGPLVGYRMTMPGGEPARIEQEVLAASALTPEAFRQAGKHKVKGARRPLRVQPKEVQLEGGVDDHGAFVTIAFTFPAGSFATVLLRELMKPQLHAPAEAAPLED